MTKTMTAGIAAVVMAVFPTSAEIYFSHELFLDVQSSSDGNGNFTYTIGGSSSNPDFAFYFTPGSGVISIHASGILGIQAPPGWQGSADNDGLVTFQCTDPEGAWIHDVPLTFGLSSAIGTATVYDDGAASGPFCEYGNPDNGGQGTESFSYLGPVVVPEPSVIPIWMLGTISLILISKPITKHRL